MRKRMGILLAACALCAVLLVPGAAMAAKYKIYLSMSFIGNDWQAEAANMVKAMAAAPNIATRLIWRCRSPAQCAAANPADQRDGAGRCEGDHRLSDFAHRAQSGGQERLRRAC